MMFWNFFKAWARVQWAKLRGYQILSDTELANHRFENHCQLCVWFDGAQCQKCGCLAMAKTMIAVEECPIHEWKAVWRKKIDEPPS